MNKQSTMPYMLWMGGFELRIYYNFAGQIQKMTLKCDFQKINKRENIEEIKP